MTDRQGRSGRMDESKGRRGIYIHPFLFFIQFGVAVLRKDSLACCGIWDSRVEDRTLASISLGGSTGSFFFLSFLEEKSKHRKIVCPHSLPAKEELDPALRSSAGASISGICTFGRLIFVREYV
ncbi:hypothetical protein F4821DRAFT_234567, partial [Hypoxylon rubiginosum]